MGIWSLRWYPVRAKLAALHYWFEDHTLALHSLPHMSLRTAGPVKRKQLCVILETIRPDTEWTHNRTKQLFSRQRGAASKRKDFTADWALPAAALTEPSA